MSETSQTDYSSEFELSESLKEKIEEVVRLKKLTKEQKEKLEKEVKKQHFKERFEPGEVIGIIAAQSISEPATQMTMRTYHTAATAGIRVTYGLPRLIEIFDAKKSPETPMLTIYLKKSFNTPTSATKIAEDIVEKRVFHFIKRISINLNENAIDIDILDKRSLPKIVKVLKEGFKEIKIKEKTDKITVYPKEGTLINELQKLKEKILNVHVSGIKAISNGFVSKEGDNWIINTIGSNLAEVLKVDEVDETKTISNDIHEVSSVLGIEAARNVIIREAIKTMQQQALDVDIRHVMLVGDIMTFSGEVKSIGRYGIAGAKTSILARAAFEETIKHLVRASIRNEVDEFQGIFENVMIGQVIPSGTGMFDLVAKIEEENK